MVREGREATRTQPVFLTQNLNMERVLGILLTVQGEGLLKYKLLPEKSVTN